MPIQPISKFCLIQNKVSHLTDTPLFRNSAKEPISVGYHFFQNWLIIYIQGVYEVTNLVVQNFFRFENVRTTCSTDFELVRYAVLTKNIFVIFFHFFVSSFTRLLLHYTKSPILHHFTDTTVLHHVIRVLRRLKKVQLDSST